MRCLTLCVILWQNTEAGSEALSKVAAAAQGELHTVVFHFAIVGVWQFLGRDTTLRRHTVAAHENVLTALLNFV